MGNTVGERRHETTRDGRPATSCCLPSQQAGPVQSLGRVEICALVHSHTEQHPVPLAQRGRDGGASLSAVPSKSSSAGAHAGLVLCQHYPQYYPHLSHEETEALIHPRLKGSPGAELKLGPRQSSFCGHVLPFARCTPCEGSQQHRVCPACSAEGCP